MVPGRGQKLAQVPCPGPEIEHPRPLDAVVLRDRQLPHEMRQRQPVQIAMRHGHDRCKIGRRGRTFRGVGRVASDGGALLGNAAAGVNSGGAVL